MASVEALVSDGIFKIGLDNDGSGQTSDVHESNDLGDDLLHDLDLYLEDINDRLTISRMASDSIIKGMVNAVSQEAAEIVAAKELEVASLKEVVWRQQCGISDTNTSTALTTHDGLELHNHHAESISLLNQTIKEQWERFGQCIANIKGLFGNFKERLIIKNDLDGAFNCLEAMLKDMSQQVDIITFSPQSYIEEWKVDLDIRKEMEMMVFCVAIKGLQDEYENQIWVGSNAVALNERFDELAALRHELVSIQSCFVGPQVGNISPQGSIEMDHPHHKVSRNHCLPSAQLWSRNETCEESIYSMPENLETSPLKHMHAPELYQHFKTLITEMKREHVSNVQQMTEENFSLKRDLLKERESVKKRGSFAVFKKDKDSETLRKKISEVIAKLDDIIKEDDKLSEFYYRSMDMLDTQLAENCCFKDSLKIQKLKSLYFSSQPSDDTKKPLQHSEKNLHKLVGALKFALKDEHIETYVREEIYNCIIRETYELVNNVCEDLDLKSVIMQDILGIVYGEVYRGGVSSNSDNEDLEMQSFLGQQIYDFVFQEVIGDLLMKVDEWNGKCLEKDGIVGLLQRKVSEIENELAEKEGENEELRLQALLLEISIKENNRVSLEVIALHEKERVQLIEEQNKLREQEACKNNELLSLTDKLEDCEKQIEKLNMELKFTMNKLKSDEEKTNFISVLNQNLSASIKEKDNEHNKHMESLGHVIQGLSKSFVEFELKIKESILWHNVRLENSAFQLHSLIPKINVLGRTSLLYRERLENKCSDLQKAEAEVDLLGDEVDTLLSLLEKIYVALDHYSPVLQHYPGIIEILKLVKRELSGDTVKGCLTAT